MVHIVQSSDKRLRKLPVDTTGSSNRRDMLAELRDDSKRAAASLREARGLCDEHGDVASASLLEVWIDQAARRT